VISPSECKGRPIVAACCADATQDIVKQNPITSLTSVFNARFLLCSDMSFMTESPRFRIGCLFNSGFLRRCLSGELPAAFCLGLGTWSMDDGFEQSMVIELSHLFHRSKLRCFLGLPGCSAVD
jgi:hypothetical protein